MIHTSFHCASTLLLLFLASSLYSQIFSERNLEEISYNRLHPQDTSEIQQSLSSDLEEKEKSQEEFFAAVIDAGSTGTRLHLFEFSHDHMHVHGTFKLEAETFKEIKPGVSCFAKTPELAAENVRELLLIAKKYIPQELWAKTPLTFKATAGVRLLSEREADAILTNVESEIMSSGFLVNDDAVGVLSGTDEGVFGWFTLNFLLGRLNNALEKKGKSAVALDLGGGSTQVTFLPNDFATAIRGVSRQKYSHRLRVFDKELRLYTHSYLGNGLVASRLGISKLSSPEWSLNTAPTLKTHCLPNKFVLDDWDYAGNVWLISATPDASSQNCLEMAKQYINLTDIKPVAHSLLDEDIYLFGYYYDRAIQANIVEYSLEQTGGEARIGDFGTAAERACAISAEAIGPEPWRPWQCLDLTYIYALLHYGYGLPDEKTIHLAKKIRSMETSWALGSAFHLLNSYHETRLRERREQRDRELQAALERDRKELERKQKEIEERESAVNKIPSLTGNIIGFGGIDDRKSSLANFVINFIQRLSDILMHLLSSLNIIS